MLTGSWAGVMGQTQFMPYSYLADAVDVDGDGRRDIWRSTPDVLASTAQYLATRGWKAGERWGREVVVGDRVAGLVAVAVPLQLVGPCHAGLVYANDEALLAYNCAHTYALSVALLADRIRERAAWLDTRAPAAAIALVDHPGNPPIDVNLGVFRLGLDSYAAHDVPPRGRTRPQVRADSGLLAVAATGRGGWPGPTGGGATGRWIGRGVAPVGSLSPAGRATDRWCVPRPAVATRNLLI